MAARVRSEVRAAFSNMLLKSVSLPIEKVCRLALVIVAAPRLGQAGFGRFQFAATVTTLLALGTDLGLATWTTRTLARSRARAATVVRTGLRVRALAALPCAVVMALVAYAMGPGEARAAMVFLGVTALVNAFADHFAAIFRGYERFRDETKLNVTRAVLLTGAGLGALALDRSVVALTVGMAAGTLAGAAYGLRLIRRATPVAAGAADPGTFDPALARLATREGLPIWLAGLLSLLYFKGDAVLLRLFCGDSELGAYGAAYKFFEGAMLVPAILMAGAFPPLARAHGHRERQRPWEVLIVTALLALGLLAGASVYLGSASLVALVFGPGFVRAVPSLRVLSLGLPLLFLNFGLTHLLIARDLQRRNLVLAGSMLVLNVSLNLVLTPRLGGPGAAWATVVTEAALTGSCLATLSWRPLRRAAVPPPAPGAASTDRMTG
jgi:O-antigen/teichoic acid export membrane protein